MRQNNKNESLPSKVSSDAGFTLLEMMIAATVFMIVMASIFGILRAGNDMKEVVSERSDISDNARTIVEFIGRDVVNTGLGYSRTGAVVPDDFLKNLLAIPGDTNTLRDIAPGIVAGNEVSSSALSENNEKNDLIFLIARDLRYNDGVPISINSMSSATTPTMTTNTNSCVNCKKWDVFMFESPLGKQALGIATAVSASSITLAPGDPLGLNRITSGTAETRSILTPCSTTILDNCFDYSPRITAKRVFLMAYRVRNDGTLLQTTFGNNAIGSATEQIQDKELAYGVKSMQLRYLLTDGTIVDDPSNGFVDPMRLNNVVQVQLKLVVKSESTVNGKPKIEYINLGSMFSTRNLRYAYD